jgi:hypothetical protein
LIGGKTLKSLLLVQKEYLRRERGGREAQLCTLFPGCLEQTRLINKKNVADLPVTAYDAMLRLWPHAQEASLMFTILAGVPANAGNTASRHNSRSFVLRIWQLASGDLSVQHCISDKEDEQSLTDLALFG